MDKENAWMLGCLLSDGCITRPTYRSKGDESHLQFICKYDDRAVMYKLKNILGATSNVGEYPDYKSPCAKLRVYNRQDIIEKYNDIKTNIPSEDIKGFERHFIRGLIDGDGTLSTRYRKSNNQVSFRIGFIDEYEQITTWVADTICNTLLLPPKKPRWVPQSNVWEIIWEGNIARLIAFWLYHGDIENCCLDRKKGKYVSDVLNGQTFNNTDDELLYAVKAIWNNDGDIAFATQCTQTLPWCHRVQKLLSFNTQPVFHNPGKRKYYVLHVPKNCVANMRDAS